MRRASPTNHSESFSRPRRRWAHPGIAWLLFALLWALPATLWASAARHTTHVGGCLIEYEARHRGTVTALSDICNRDIFHIYEQLGADFSHLYQRSGAVNIRIVAHPDQMPQHAPPGISLPAWSGAVAFPGHNLILLPLARRDGGPNTGYEITLLHELSHIAFHRASGGARVPRWFSEGVAILQSERSSIGRRGAMWWSSLSGDLPSLADIEHYPEGAMAAEHAYAMAADFCASFIGRGGWRGVRYLLKLLSEGEDFARAFDTAFGRSLHQAEAEWRSRVLGSSEWLLLLTSSTAAWSGMLVLFVFAWIRARERKRQQIERMAQEEAPLDHLIETLSQMALDAPDKMPESASGAASLADGDSPDDASPEKPRARRRMRMQIRVDGRIHTLH